VRGDVDRGSFGVVHRAIERATGRNWAAKFVACTTIERAMVRGEIDIRNDLRHPNLLQLHEAFETHGEMAFILELYDQHCGMLNLSYSSVSVLLIICCCNSSCNGCGDVSSQGRI